MQVIDTHCHIHSPEFFTEEEAEQALKSAIAAGVDRLICIATSLEDSKAAIAFARAHSENVRASVGIHPHEASKYTKEEIEDQLTQLAALLPDEMVVAVGECGFDFYYNDRVDCLTLQTQLLKGQIELAQKHSLPLSFHVREAFEDFWPIFESYSGIRGVLHSFTDRPEQAERAIKHGLYFGINGIATFTTHLWQTEQFKTLPLEHIVFETDAPFLTPKPKRGTMNSPEYVIYVTKYLAELRGEDVQSISGSSTENVRRLFGRF